MLLVGCHSLLHQDANMHPNGGAENAGPNCTIVKCGTENVGPENTGPENAKLENAGPDNTGPDDVGPKCRYLNKRLKIRHRIL